MISYTPACVGNVCVCDSTMYTVEYYVHHTSQIHTYQVASQKGACGELKHVISLTKPLTNDMAKDSRA
jgi:hypothetical protein